MYVDKGKLLCGSWGIYILREMPYEKVGGDIDEVTKLQPNFG